MLVAPGRALHASSSLLDRRLGRGTILCAMSTPTPRCPTCGGLLGLLLHAMTGGRRDFAPASGMRASRYDLQVDDEAARLLA